MADTYTKDVQNCFRLSCLLINEGSQCLRNTLVSEVAKLNQGDLNTVLLQTPVKDMMKDYRFGKNGRPQILTKPQYDLLYPSKGKANVQTFDLTLLCQLLNTLCNVPRKTSATSKDYSLGADVYRLRKIRNSLFGHISRLEMTDSDFNKNWSGLENILLRLNADEGIIHGWKSCSLSPEDFESYRDEIKVLFESDLSDVQAMSYAVIAIAEEQRSDLKSLVTDVEKFEKMLKDIQLSLDNRDYEKNVLLLQSILLGFKDDISQLLFKEGISDEKELLSVLLKKHDTLMEGQVNMQSTQSEILETVQTIENKMTKPLQNAMPIQSPVADTDSLQRFTTILDKNKDAFKILVINEPGNQYDVQTMLDFCQALGSVPWDIIIDLDHESRTPLGLHDKIKSTLSNITEKDIIPCTYAQTKSIKHDTKERIAQGLCTLYMLANGCKETDCPSCEDTFGKSIMKISHLIDSVLEALQLKKNIITITTVLSDKSIIGLNEMLQLVRRAGESNDEMINLKESHTFLLHMDVLNGNIIEKPSDLWNYQQIESSIGQATHMLDQWFSQKTEIEYYFPGKKGPCRLRSREMAQLKGIVELFHRDIGILDESMDQDQLEDTINTIKFSFLKGGELTAEALCLNRKNQVFVTRKEMTNLEEKISSELQARKEWGSNIAYPYFLVKHSASGGGSTSVRFVLYELRDLYPCILVQKNVTKETLFDIVKKIYQQSRLPVLIVIDCADFGSKYAASLHVQLINHQIKSMIVLVQRMDIKSLDNDNMHTNAVIQSFEISSNITNDMDRISFRNLYQITKKEMQVKKVFLFGLLAFCGEYQRLEQHIETCIESSDFEQKNILRVVCFIWKYTHICTKGKLVCLLLPSLWSCESLNGLVSSLGYASDLLIWQNEGLRPAHDCIIEPLLKRLAGNKPGEQLQRFIEDMKILFEKDGEEKKESTNVLTNIFVQKSEYRQRGKSHTYWTMFINDLQKYCSTEYTVAAIEEIEAMALKFQIAWVAHCRILLARYLMYGMNDHDHSIEVIHKAMQIEVGQSVSVSPVRDEKVLNTYGYLMRQYLLNKYEKAQSNKDLDTAAFLLFARNYAFEAVLAFKRAQQLTKNFSSSHADPQYALSFVGEAKVRVNLLKVYFHLHCKYNHVDFSAYIRKCKDDFIKTCEHEAMEAISSLEILLTVNRLLVDDYHGTLESVQHVKFDCLRLHFDDGDSIQKVLENLQNDTPYDIGNIIRTRSYRLHHQEVNSKIPWHELGKSKLDMIISYIDKRINTRQMIRCNYRDIIYGMIHIRNLDPDDIPENEKKRLGRYNIDLAIGIAKSWVGKYEQDIDGHFILGSLLLLKGVKENSMKGIEFIRRSLESFEKCEELCNRYKTIEQYKRKRFAIGTGGGLAGLVPYNRIYLGRLELMNFTGRQVGKHEVKVTNFNMLKCKIDHCLEDTLPHQENMLSYNIVIAYDNLIAINTSIQDEATGAHEN